MKKIYLMCAVALLAAVGCNKEISDGYVPAGSVVLTATVETDVDAPAAKVGATVDKEAGKVAFTWTKNDVVAVQTASGFEDFTLSGNGGSATGEFAGNATPAAGGVAVFPADAAGSVSGTALAVNLPASYTYEAGQTNALLYASVSADNKMYFKHLGGLVALELKGVPAGAKLVFTAEGKKLNGSYTVDLGAEIPQVAVAATETASESTVTVNFPEAIAEAVAYLPLPVGEYSSWTAQVISADELVLKEVATTQAKSVARKTLKAMPYMVVNITDWFVTPAGAGKKDGSSWDNALGVAELRALIAQPVDGEGVQVDADAHALAAVLDGDTFHMAAGDYYLAGEAGGQLKMEFSNYAKQVEVSLLGGYPANLQGTSKDGRDASVNVTAFTGNKEAGIFLLGNQVAPTFNGVTFKDASFAETDGGAIFASAGESGDITLTLKDCRFVDNKNTDSKSGAAIYLKKVQATIEKCYFSGNYARNGSAVCAAAADGKVTISECTFENNSTANTSGAVQNGGRTLEVSKCIFKGNHADSWGGAFHANGEGSVTEFSECQFVENTSTKNGGAVSIQVAQCTFDNCTFTSNRADKAVEGDDKYASKAGGAIFLYGEGSQCTLNACTLTANSAPNGCAGAILCSENAVLNINAGTTFSGNTSLYYGGAIYADNVFPVKGTSDSRVVFSGNKTLDTGNGTANGGAIYLWTRNDAAQEMTHVLFTGNEAGQESGTTVNYSNGGGLLASGKVALTMTDCEFTDNRARNGGGISYGSSLSSVLTRCNFHDNVCRSGANKDGSNGSGNFNGAAMQQGNGAIEFVECVFNKNVVQGSSAVLHMNGNGAVASFTDCQFTENQSFGNHGCIKMEKAGQKLYVNRCLFKGNSAASRGMIQPTGNTLAYLNDVTFKDNVTTASGNSWGVAVHQGQANVCMNNVTSYNNYNSNSSQDKVISFNGDGGWLITNSTVIDKTPYAVVRVGNAAGHMVICNNILINTHTAANAFEVTEVDQFVDKGYNILSCSGAHKNATPAVADLLSQSETTLAGSYGESWTGTHPYGVYSWTNSLADFTGATSAAVYEAISGYTRTDTNVVADGTIGADFWNWLLKIGAVTESGDVIKTFKDARGVTRTDNFWPGAYQAN